MSTQVPIFKESLDLEWLRQLPLQILIWDLWQLSDSTDPECEWERKGWLASASWPNRWALGNEPRTAESWIADLGSAH